MRVHGIIASINQEKQCGYIAVDRLAHWVHFSRHGLPAGVAATDDLIGREVCAEIYPHPRPGMEGRFVGGFLRFLPQKTEQPTQQG